MAKTVEVGIHYKLIGIDELKSSLIRSQKEQEAAFNAQMGRQTKAHSDSMKTIKGHYDEYRAGALNSIKTVEEYRQDYSKKSTKVLVSHIKELQDKRVDEQAALARSMAEADKVQTRIHKNRLEQITLESRALKQVSIEREEVQKKGAGALVGQLGIGRYTSMFSGLSGIGDMSGAEKTMAVAATGIGVVTAAAYLGEKAFTALEGAARKYEEGQDRLAIALTRSGLKGNDLRTELTADSKTVDKLAVELAKPREEIAQTMGSLAAYSRESGVNLKRITELTIAISESTGMEMTRIARMVGKGMNPEIQADMQRLGINIDKNATALQRMDALERQYGATVDETKSRMQEGVHEWDRLTLQVSLAAEQFANHAFHELTPEFQKLGPLVKNFGDRLSSIQFGPAIERMKTLYHWTSNFVGVLSGSEAKNAISRLEEIEMNDAKNHDKRMDRLREERALRQGSAFDKSQGGSGDMLEAQNEALRLTRGLSVESQMAQDQIQKDADDARKKREKKTGANSFAAINETYAARRWMRDKELAEQKQEAQKSYQTDVEAEKVQTEFRIVHLQARLGQNKIAEEEIYKVRKDSLTATAEFAKRTYGEESKEYQAFLLELEKLNLEHTNKAQQEEERHATNILAINRKMQDQSVASIVDKAKREAAAEDLRYQRQSEDLLQEYDMQKIQQDELHSLLEQNEQVHWDTINKIALDALQEQRSFAQSLVKDGLQPIANALQQQISDWIKVSGIGKTATEIITGFLAKVANTLAERGAKKIANAIYGDDTSGVKPKKPDLTGAGDDDIGHIADGDVGSASGRKVVKGGYRKLWVGLNDIAIDKSKVPGLTSGDGSTSVNIEASKNRAEDARLNTIGADMRGHPRYPKGIPIISPVINSAIAGNELSDRQQAGMGADKISIQLQSEVTNNTIQAAVQAGMAGAFAALPITEHLAEQGAGLLAPHGTLANMEIAQGLHHGASEAAATAVEAGIDTIREPGESAPMKLAPAEDPLKQQKKQSDMVSETTKTLNKFSTVTDTASSAVSLLGIKSKTAHDALSTVGQVVGLASGLLGIGTAIFGRDESGKEYGGPIYAAKGFASGPRGTDTVPTWLTPGEEVATRGAAKKYPGIVSAMNSGQYMPSQSYTIVNQSQQSSGVGMTDAHMKQFAQHISNALVDNPPVINSTHMRDDWDRASYRRTSVTW